MLTSIFGRLGTRPFIKSLTILLCFAAPTPTVQQLSQELCSSLNTGSDSSPVSNHFNSNGACQTACSGFAFAIVQDQDCWCSNYAPADTTSTGDCSEACPGYPYENCGSASSGLFGYIALSNAPSGTIGASPSTSTTSTPTSTTTPTPTTTTSDTVHAVSTQPLPSGPLGTVSSFEATFSSTSGTFPVVPTVLLATGLLTAIPLAASPLISHVLTSSSQTTSSSDPSPDPVTVQDTVTESPSVSVSFVSITPSTTSTSTSTSASLIHTPTTTSTPTTFTTSTPTPNTKSSTTTSSSSWSATPFTSVTTVTGQVKTMTITPTAPPATATTIITAAKESNGGFFSNSGKVAGTFVVVAIVLLLLVAGVIWFFLRRSRKRQPEAAVLPSTADSSTPQRRPSRLSQMGLVGVGGNQREKTAPTIPVIQTSGWGPSTGNGSEKSPADTLSAVDRRSSYPRVVDQRLEPTALWNPLHDNGSHVSVRSFRDDQDYSRRMLRIANPDDG